jgi:hypothetical protein
MRDQDFLPHNHPTTTTRGIFKAQLLVKVDKVYSLKPLKYDRVTVTFTIPHISKNPLLLADDEGYKVLLKRVPCGKTDTIVHIQVEEVVKKVCRACIYVLPLGLKAALAQK